MAYSLAKWISKMMKYIRTNEIRVGLLLRLPLLTIIARIVGLGGGTVPTNDITQKPSWKLEFQFATTIPTIYENRPYC
jgi:hypothetical protein